MDFYQQSFFYCLDLIVDSLSSFRVESFIVEGCLKSKDESLKDCINAYSSRLMAHNP